MSNEKRTYDLSINNRIDKEHLPCEVDDVPINNRIDKEHLP